MIYVSLLVHLCSYWISICLVYYKHSTCSSSSTQPQTLSASLWLNKHFNVLKYRLGFFYFFSKALSVSPRFQMVNWPAFNLLQLSLWHLCTFTPIIQHSAVIYSQHSAVETLLKRIWKNTPAGLLVHQTAVRLLVRMQPVDLICLWWRKEQWCLIPSWLLSPPRS